MKMALKEDVQRGANLLLTQRIFVGDDNRLMVGNSVEKMLPITEAEGDVLVLCTGTNTLEDIVTLSGSSPSYVESVFERMIAKEVIVPAHEWNKIRFDVSSCMYTVSSGRQPQGALEYVDITTPCDLRPLSVAEKRWLRDNTELKDLQDNECVLANSVYLPQLRKGSCWELVVRGARYANIWLGHRLIDVIVEVFTGAETGCRGRECVRLTDVAVSCDDHYHEHLRQLVKRSIEQVSRDYRLYGNDKPAILKFSGGKDSLVLLSLVMQADVPMHVVFVNIGLESPCTLEYVKEVERRLGYRIHVYQGDVTPENFFKGPPTLANRWCTREKLALVQKGRQELVSGNGCLYFEGSRKYEEDRRFFWPVHKDDMDTASYVCHPLYEWTALDVWLYIADRRLDANPLYEAGCERVSCWCCPGSTAISRHLHSNQGNQYSKYRAQLEALRPFVG